MSDTTQPGADNALEFDKLEALARAADQGEGQHIYCHPRDSNNWKANGAWQQAASPETVLALIALARRAAQPVEAKNSARPSVIPLPGGESLQYEARTTGAPGWLLYDGAGKLHHALSLADVEIIEATIAATHPAEPVAPQSAEPIAYLVREQLLAGEWAEWETTTEEVYRFRTNRPRSNIQVKAVYDHPAEPAVKSGSQDE